MTTFTKTIKAAFLAAVLGITSFAAPAYAGGQFSFNIAPRDAEQAQLMQLGLGIYSLAKKIDEGGITQNGRNNRAGLAQSGGGNRGVIHQEGNNHNGTLEQSGGNNSYGLFQFGKGTNAHVNQRGNDTGLGFIFGW